MYTLQVLASLASNQGLNEVSVSEDRIVAWANEKVASAGKSTRIKHFKDSTIKNSKFLLDLVAAIEPRAVELQLISTGSQQDDFLNNAKYVISCARKANACVFLTPEDIVEVKSKMLLTFVSALWTADIIRNK
jgi:plastin-1